jgi:hypothetical protein
LPIISSFDDSDAVITQIIVRVGSRGSIVTNEYISVGSTFDLHHNFAAWIPAIVGNADQLHGPTSALKAAEIDETLSGVVVVRSIPTRDLVGLGWVVAHFGWPII